MTSTKYENPAVHCWSASVEADSSDENVNYPWGAIATARHKVLRVITQLQVALGLSTHCSTSVNVSHRKMKLLQ